MSRTSSHGGQSGNSTLAIIKAQIVFLCSTLAADSYAKNEREINALIDAHGAEANLHLIRRLIQSSAPALAAPPSAQVPHPIPTSYLSLRLLISSVKKLARDPLMTHRFREAILSGLNDTSSGSASAEAFRQLGENLAAFCDRAGFNGLERLILALEMCRVLIVPTANGQQQSAVTRNALALHAKSKEFGIAAVQLVRDSWTVGVECLAAGQAADSVGPVGLSRLLDRVASDWKIDLQAGEMGIWTDQERGKVCESLVDVQSKRDLVRAIRARLGRELATQVTIHSFEGMESVAFIYSSAESSKSFRFAATTSTVDIIHRLIPDINFCTPELLRAIIMKHAKLPVPPTSETETKIASILTDAIALADQVLDGFSMDMAVFVRVLTDQFPPNSGEWGSLLLAIFDKPTEVKLPQYWGTRVVAGLLTAAPTALAAFFGDWEHTDRQLELIGSVLSLPTDVFSFGAITDNTRRIINADTLANMDQSLQQIAQAYTNSPFNSTDLIRTLLRLAGISDQEDKVVALFERHSSVPASGEILLLGLVASPKISDRLQTQLADKLLHNFLVGAAGSQLVLHCLWQTERRQDILSGIVMLYNESELNVSRIVDIGQELHILSDILELRPFRLALDVAALASRRDYLDLARWLQTCISRHGSAFVKEMLTFVGSKVRTELRRNEMDPSPESTTMPMLAQAVAIFMRTLRLNHELFSAEDVELFKEVRTLSLQLHPRLLNFARGADQEPGISVASFPPEVDADVDATFKRMYEGEITVEEVVTILQRARDSGEQNRIEFYQCMLHGLMDEMRFVAAYPAQELLLTAHLFGLLIQHQIIHHIPLGIAVRYVLDALKHPPNSASYRFGITALTKFQNRLQEWPQLASALLAIPHVASASPDVATYAKAALAEPGSAEALALQRLVGHQVEANKPIAFPALRELSDDSPINKPSEETTDKILFIINNLSPSNVDTKVPDLASKLKESDFRWFANYLVASRVCIEPNNHGLYLQLLDALGFPELDQHILRQSYIKSASLLNAEQTVSSSTDRTLLKNLGAWLGAITLARDKPIRHSNLAFKDLLIQGFDNGRMIVAIPFVCKILEQCSRSRVFKPPNPWLVAVLRLLAELYQFAELRLNLKFEIEVLCKGLNIDIKDLEPADLLRNRPSKTAEAVQDLATVTPLSVTANTAARNLQPPVMLSGQAGYANALQDSITTALASLANYVIFSPAVHFISANAGLKRLVYAAIDRAVREIIVPVVERSVTIAGISTRELTSKDFAMEGNEAKLQQAAHLMVRTLAGSLALVTCKEPLRLSIITQLKNLMLQNGFVEQTLPEQAISIIATDNLELACSIVERVAMDKAVSEVDEGLTNAYEIRRQHRETTSAAFWDTAAVTASHYSAMLPDPLRLKLNGLHASQLQVYEDFGNLRLITAANRDPAVEEVDGYRLGQGTEVAAAGLLTVQQAVDQFSHIVTDLDNTIASETAYSLASLPPDSEISSILGQLPVLASRSFHADETALACSQKVVQLLYRASSDLGREAYAILLQRLCSVSEKVVREVISWLIYADDERKYDIPVTLVLLQHDIVPLAEYEAQLAKSVQKDFRTGIVDFAAQLVRAAFSTDPPAASRDQFAHVIDALLQASRADRGTHSSIELLQDLRLGVGSAATARQEIENQEIKDQLTRFFISWVRFFQQSSSIERAFVDYVVQLQEHGILKGEDLSSRFFRTCTETSIDSYIKQKAAGGTIASGIFQPVDALGALIAFMLKYHGNGSGDQSAADAKAFYLTKVMSIVVLVLAQAHEEMGLHFAVTQKPFFRLFSALLNNLHNIESNLAAAFPRIMVALSHSVNTLQPLHFPGFAFSWMALISHRLFMPKLLRDRDGQAAFHRLLLSLLRFITPFLQETPLRQSVRSLYEGTCKIFLVLLHDFPGFLAAYHSSLCDAMPPSCRQLQNVVLSAFPADIVLPDPFQADILASQDFQRAPIALVDYSAQLVNVPELADTLDRIFKGAAAADAILQHKHLFVAETANKDAAFNQRLITATSILCLDAATTSGRKSGGTFDAQHPAVLTLITMLDGFDAEGRYHLLSTLANQLRYPNTHTRMTISLILHAFGSPNSDDLVKEIIVRVLLERICVVRPHPFGLVLTIIELLRRFPLLEQPFFQQRPEIKALLPLFDRINAAI